MKEAPASTLTDVAKAAGVSAMTVSRVLHHSKRVLPATRARVKRAMRALRYRPDPHFFRLMTLVRGRKARSTPIPLAIVRDTAASDALHDSAYQYVSLPDIRRRALLHGYEAEEFCLGRDGLTPARLSSVLQARGIEGMILSPQSTSNDGARIDYAPFAAATFGYGLISPALHRASTNMTQGILMATEQLTHRGYQRIGLAITQWIDARADFTYSGAMLHFQQTIPRNQRVPLLLFPENKLESGERAFRRWFQKCRPDAVISFHLFIPQWLKALGLRIPKDVGLVVHDWTAQMEGWAGIHHRRIDVAAAAVDLVAQQLLQNERGVPEVPRQVLLPPLWVEGDSIRRITR